MDSEDAPISIMQAKIVHKTYINVDLLEKYHKKFHKDLLQALSAIVQKKDKSSQTSLLQTVSLQLAQISRQDYRADLKNILSPRKTVRSMALANIIVPSLESRLQIEATRSQMIKKIRQGTSLDQNQLIILLEIYNLLNFCSDFTLHVKGYLAGQNLKELKQKLTSIKKMMGGSPKLQIQEKQEKKKAYLKNLQFREFMGEVCKQIKEERIRNKLEKVLEVPKNKKWIGCRFHKLLLQNNWDNTQIQALYHTLRGFMIGNQLQEWKNLKKSKSSLRILLRNLENIMKKPYQQSANKLEQSEQYGSQELQSLISIDESFSSRSLRMVLDEEIMEFQDSEEDFF